MFLLLLLSSLLIADAIDSHFTRLSPEESNHLLSSCGKSNEEAPDGSWLIQVWNADSQIRCGGVAITPYHVLTLPMCIKNHATTAFASVDDLYQVLDGRVFPTDVQHHIVPVFKNKTLTHDFRLAILEVEDRSYMRDIILVCLPPSNRLMGREQSQWTYTYDTTSRKSDKYKTVFESRTRFCVDEKTCEWFLTTSSRLKAHGDALTYEKEGGSQISVISLAMSDNESVDLHPWLHFLCVHTGACDKDLLMVDDEIPVFDYYFDGVIVKHGDSPPQWYCNEDKRRVLAEIISPLTRIDQADAATLRRTCGIQPRINVLEEQYSYIVGIVMVEEGEKYSFCTGTLISSMHVITSASCMRQKTKEAKMYAVFQYLEEDKGDATPVDYPKFDPDDSGKRYLAITKFVATICTNEHCEAADVAIAQLEARIPPNSFVNLCIPEEPPTAARDASLIVQKMKSKLSHFDANQSITSAKPYSKDIDDITVSTSLYNCSQTELRCRLLQFGERILTENIEIGAPLVVLDEGHLTLIGVTTHPVNTTTTSFVNLATRIDYLATFICVHTGVCRRKEDYRGDSFSPYVDKNFIVETFAVENLRKLKKKEDHEIYSNWNAMSSELDKIAEAMGVYKMQRLSEAENEEVQAMCGKKAPRPVMIDGADVSLTDHPWAVMPAFHLKYLGEKRDGYMVIGTGSFISKRHVITAAHIFDYMNSYGKSIFSVIYGTNCAGKAECTPTSEQRVASVRRVIKTKSVMDIAIMELHEDIKLDATQSILCMPRQSETYKEDRPVRLYGAGYLTSDMTVGSPGHLKMREFAWKDLNVTYYPRYGDGTLEYYIVYEKTKHFGMPGDSGGPMIRERADDGKSVLWAVHSGMLRLKAEFREKEERARSYAVNTDQIRSFVCKFTGVCTNGYDKYDEAAIPITISDNIPLC